MVEINYYIINTVWQKLVNSDTIVAKFYPVVIIIVTLVWQELSLFHALLKSYDILAMVLLQELGC